MLGMNSSIHIEHVVKEIMATKIARPSKIKLLKRLTQYGDPGDFGSTISDAIKKLENK